jgi:phenylpropionate dioxygenase-like ring-hydroxylating dioxygenase large terminal subunit
VPETRDFICLEKSENSLMEVRCEVLHGMIFINLDGNADPLEKTHAPIAQQLQVGNFPIGEVVVKGMITVEMDCNWKIAYDNFLEIYHVRTVHARSVARFLNSNSFSISLFENGHSRFVTRKRDSSSVFGKDAPTETRPDDFFMDYTMALPIFPNTFMPIDPIGFTCQNYWPVSPEKSMMVMYMLGWKAEGKEDEEFWAGMRAQIEGIIAEDTEIFYGLQRSMRSGLLDGIKLNAQERAIYWYHQEIDRLIGTSNLPTHLRVEPVLNPTTIL